MNNMDDNTTNWAIVELMGHKVVAGLIQKSEMLGKPARDPGGRGRRAGPGDLDQRDHWDPAAGALELKGDE